MKDNPCLLIKTHWFTAYYLFYFNRHFHLLKSDEESRAMMAQLLRDPIIAQQQKVILS